MISIEDITVRFGGVTALNAVSARMGAPITGIIGPNGAGKTTLLNVLSGFVAPQSGRAQMGDTDLLALPPHLRARAGLRRSFQAEQIAEDLTVAENLVVMADPMGLSAQGRRQSVDRVLDVTGLTGLRDALGARLTNVERRLTEIGRALVAHPQVLMLDEPGGGLGAVETDRLRDLIAAIPETFGVQILLIDHDVELIRAVCDETLVIDFGRRIAFGRTEDVLESPAVRAAYLGEDTDGVA